MTARPRPPARARRSARNRSWSSGTPNADRKGATAAGTIPKYTAPSPSSTAVCRISSAAIPVSMCQNGTGHRASSLSVQPLSSCA